jgi:hypothetical protein
MVYNRYGYALLVIVLVECFQRIDRSSAAPKELLGGLSTGAALALTFFLKASYFLAGLGLVGVSFILWLPSRRRFLGFVAGFSAVTFLGLAYMRFELAAMLRGLRFAAGARTQSLSLETPIHTIAGQLLPLLCGLSVALAASFLKPRQPERFAELKLLAGVVVISIADIALLATNMQPSGLPLLGAFGILIANRFADPEYPFSSAEDQSTLPYYASVLLLSGSLIWPQLVLDVLALPSAALLKSHPPPSCAVRFTEPRITNLILCDRSDLNPSQKRSNGCAYTNYVNEGATLLRQYCKPSDKILTIDMQNPFPYVLGWLPAKGGMASTTFDYTVSDKFRPSVDEYLGDASVVMIPKHPAQDPENLNAFYEIYRPEIEKRFSLAGESDWFRLYKRK